jgi:ribose transport system substrate-binding protein
VKSKRTLAASVAALGLLLAACSSSATTAPSGSAASPAASTGGGAGAAACQGKTIAVIVKAGTSTYWKTVGSGVDDAKAEFPGCTITFEGPDAETNVTAQIAEVESAVAKKVAAIVIAVTGADQVLPALQKAADAGIPIILIDTNKAFAPKKAFVGTDNAAGGKAAGDYFVKTVGIKAGDKVLIIRGQAGDAVHNLREQGASDVLKAAGATVIVQPADSDRAKGQSVMENVLQANPDLKAVFATNDEMALGALKAAQQATKTIPIIGFDANPDALASVAAGGLTGSIAQFPKKIGQMGVETAVKVIAGQTVDASVNTGVELVTKDNVANFK